MSDQIGIVTAVEDIPTKTGKKRERSALLPCAVCGEQGSGLHYGVNSCEACKAFFYRNANKTDDLDCDANGHCEPEPGSGYKCPSCRMKKCLEAGMSKTGFKKGRYSYKTKSSLKKKTYSNCEVKGGKSGDEKSQLNTEKEISTDGSPDTVGSQIDHSLLDLFETDITTCEQNSISSYSPELPELGKYQRTLESEASKTLTIDEITRVVKELHELYSRYPKYPQEYFCKVKGVQKQYIENKEERRRMFGQMKPVPLPEFLEIYYKTGIDVDGRLESVKSSYASFEQTCLNYVQYANELPGFPELGNEDQTSALKGAKSSFWILADFTVLDLENGLWTWTDFGTFNKDELSNFCCESYSKQLFSLTEKLRSLNLTEGEVNVLRAFVLLNPDICVTEAGKRIASNQRTKLYNVLRHLVTMNHPTHADILDKLLKIEKELLQFNHDDDISTKLHWSLYMHLFQDDKNVRIPVTKALYDL